MSDVNLPDTIPSSSNPVGIITNDSDKGLTITYAESEVTISRETDGKLYCPVPGCAAGFLYPAGLKTHLSSCGTVLFPSQSDNLPGYTNLDSGISRIEASTEFGINDYVSDTASESDDNIGLPGSSQIQPSKHCVVKDIRHSKNTQLQQSTTSLAEKPSSEDLNAMKEELALTIIRFEGHQVLLCLQCQFALSPLPRISIRSHILVHNTVRPSNAQVESLLVDVQAISPQNLPPAQHFSPPIDGLKLHTNGFYCHHCRLVLTSAHSSKRHHLSCLKGDNDKPHIEGSIYYQYWWNVRNLGSQRLAWPVTLTPVKSAPLTLNSEDLENALYQQLFKLDHKQNEPLVDSVTGPTVNSVDQGPFFIAMGWPATFLCSHQQQLHLPTFHTVCQLVDRKNMTQQELILENVIRNWFLGRTEVIDRQLGQNSEMIRVLSQINTEMDGRPH